MRFPSAILVTAAGTGTGVSEVEGILMPPRRVATTGVVGFSGAGGILMLPRRATSTELATGVAGVTPTLGVGSGTSVLLADLSLTVIRFVPFEAGMTYGTS